MSDATPATYTRLGGYLFPVKPTLTHHSAERGSSTEVYVAKVGAPVGVRVKSIVTAVSGGVRSAAFEADPSADYQGLKWTCPKGSKRASFCIFGGAVEPDCALGKLAALHTTISEEGAPVFGNIAEPFFKAGGDFVYFDFGIRNNTAICDEPHAKSHGVGAEEVAKVSKQPLPAKFRLLGFTAIPSHITVTRKDSGSDAPTVRIHFRAVFLSGGVKEELDACGIEYPRHEGGGEFEIEGAEGAGSENGSEVRAPTSHAGLTLADVLLEAGEETPDTLAMDDAIVDADSPPPGAASTSAGKESLGALAPKRPIGKKSAHLAAARAVASKMGGGK